MKKHNVDLCRILLEIHEGLCLIFKCFDQSVVCFYKFRGGVFAAKIKEDFEGSIASSVKELEAERFVPVKVARLAEGKDGCQLPTADVHVERLGADI